jgi:nitrite reductase/ring-hydroxylating ferredoxin subunit
MALMIHTIPRAALPEGTVLSFEVAGDRYFIANVDGEMQAYSVVGPSGASASKAAVAEGRVRCPLHGWPIDPIEGGCGAAEQCRYVPLRVEADGDEIRVSLPSV